MNAVFAHSSTPLETGITVIAASAGTGKTFTLAALVVRLVAELGVPVQRLLLTTYTVAATAELRDRIRARLIAALEAVTTGDAKGDAFLAAVLPQLPASAAERLQAAARDFDEATIHTIHGFCQRALRELAFETGTSFAPELVTDTTALFREVAEDYWRFHVYTAPALIAASLNSTELTIGILLKALQETAGRGNLRILPDAGTHAASKAELVSLLDEFRRNWAGWQKTLQSLLVDGNGWGKRGHYAEELRPRFEAMKAAAGSEVDGASLVAACEAFCHLTSEKIRDGTNTRKCKTPIEHPLFDFCDRFAEARRRFHEVTIAHFLAWSRGELERRKEERGILLFDDLLLRLHRALGPADAPSAASLQLGSRYDAVLVDEFQDTDPIQAGVFLNVFGSERHRLFLIGDPKQAIYAFRGADLFAYLEAVNTPGARHFTLRENQRSSTAMVQAVNALFQRTPNPFLDPRVLFEPVGAAGRADAKPLVIDGKCRAPFRFWFYKANERMTKGEAFRELPAAVVAEVSRFLQSGATIGGRLAQPGDCAVLTRSNDQAQEIAALLAANGVPAVVLSNANVFASEQTLELRAILASLADPGREPLLRAALATVTLGFTLADLLQLEAVPAKWESIRQRWQAHHDRWRQLGFIRMFREFLRIELVRTRVLSLRGGDRHLTNLQHLAELAHAAAEAQHLGPSGILHWLDQQMQDTAAREEAELRLERDDSAVRVITAHKSKGLEFPVVFCPFLWGDAGLREKSALRFHATPQELVYDLRKPWDPDHAARAQEEAFAEEARLLYVALTRAKYECHVVWGPFGSGTGKEKPPQVSALMRLLEPSTTAQTFAEFRTHAASCSPQKLSATIDELCAQQPDLFARLDLPVAPAARFENGGATSADAPVLRVFKGRIDSTWRSTSYSQLNVGIDYEAEALARKMVDRSLLRGIHAFPRGLKAGSCLHDIFEHVDFSATAEERADLLTRKLRQHAMFSPDNIAAIEELIGEIRATIPAEALARGTSLRELEFHLPAGVLNPADLQPFADGAGLTFERQRGVLTGFIDVVFEHEGRYSVLDWKSNWLGVQADAYHLNALETEIRQHRYGLQRHLYLFALHRFLGSRLPKYDPAAHLGGALYVFIRGLDAKRPELGIHRTTADLNAIAELEKLFPTA